jgi:hypothetical protein
MHSIAQFAMLRAKRAGSSATVAIADRTVANVRIDPSDCQAGYRLENDGDIHVSNGLGVYSDVGDWVTPTSAAGGDFECRATITSGTLTSGSSASGSWLALSTTRTWFVEQTTIGVKTCIFTLEIRRTSDGTVLDTATIELNAEVE